MERKCRILTQTILLLLAAGIQNLSAQQETRRERNIRLLEVGIFPGTIFQTHDFLRYGNKGGKRMDRAASFHLKYGFQFSPSSTYGRLYPGTYQGLGISYNRFSNPEEIGSPVAVYLYQGSRIAGLSPRLSLDYEWNFGLSAGWKPYDGETNPENMVIGSKINAYMNLALLLVWRPDSGWQLKAGADVTHFSNGNTHYPNAGLNTTAVRLSLVRQFGGISEKQPATAGVPPTVMPHTSYDLIVYGATLAKGISEKDKIAPGSFGVAGISFNPLYNFNRYLRAGLSLDAQYDESANIKDHIAGTDSEGNLTFYRQSFRERFGLGLSMRVEFVMPVFSINLGIGQNFIYKGDDLGKPYQTLALKTSLSRSFFLHVGYELTKFHEPKNLMLGAGFRFNSKRPRP